MPSIDQNSFARQVKLLFASHQVALPTGWRDMGEQYTDAFNPNERSVAPNPPTCLFRAATLNALHVKSAKDAGKLMEDYIDGICGAICSAVKVWMDSVAVMGAVINGPVIMISPGTLFSPIVLEGPILAKAPKNNQNEQLYSMAIAKAISTAWLAWQTGYSALLPFYPGFVAMPAGVAPPIPNTPFPLAAGFSTGESLLSPCVLKTAMLANLADAGALHAATLFDALSTAFYAAFTLFKATTVFTRVNGTGPVPAVPVGPVVAGMPIPSPGVLA